MKGQAAAAAPAPTSLVPLQAAYGAPFHPADLRPHAGNFVRGSKTKQNTGGTGRRPRASEREARRALTYVPWRGAARAEDAGAPCNHRRGCQRFAPRAPARWRPRGAAPRCADRTGGHGPYRARGLWRQPCCATSSAPRRCAGSRSSRTPAATPPPSRAPPGTSSRASGRRRRPGAPPQCAPALRLQVVEAHLLERHDLATQRVPCLVHIAVRALADLGEREKRCNFSPRRSRAMDHEAGEAEERAHLVDLLEGVGAARGPAIDGLAGDGGEPGGPAGGDLLAARLVGEAPAHAHLRLRRRGGGARRPRPALPLHLRRLLRLLVRLLLRRRGGVGGVDPLLLRLGAHGVVPAAGGGDGGRGAGGVPAAVHTAHGAGPRSPAAGQRAREASAASHGNRRISARRRRIRPFRPRIWASPARAAERMKSPPSLLREARGGEGTGDTDQRCGSNGFETVRERVACFIVYRYSYT
ncbi:hypothetical protein PVAP13_1NG467419 [Panicum virgatum]|uniref:Uncharacterized protein n=1 Tax=Panicum virgatum TaxID=38727 RepID=A0A8T0XE37_PANVG|nr:hypothetical protein PVAP13_1NG467419 [Panicum virgatum]